MPGPNDPSAPISAAPQAQQATQQAAPIDVKAIESLERYRDLQSRVNITLMDYSKTAAEAVQKTEELKQKFISNEEAINATLVSTDKLNTKYDLFSKNLETQIEHTKKLADTLETKLKKTVQDNIDLEEEYKALKGQNIEQLDLEADKLKKVQELLSGGGKTYAEMSTAERVKLAKDLEKANITNNIIEAQKILIQVEHQRNKQLQEAIPSQLNENRLLELRKGKLQDVNKAAGDLVNKLAGANSQNNLFASSLISMGEGADKFIKSIGSGFLDSFLKPEMALNRFFNFLNKNLIQSTFEFDKVLSDVNKTTGGFRDEFEKIAMNKAGPFSASAIGGIATYGVGIKELGAAYTALSSKINGFNRMSEEQRLLLSKNAATMETLGLSASTYANITATYMGTIGKTAEGAKETVNLLARDAIAAGRNVGEYAKEFEGLMPKIVGYGREATQIFKELNAFAGMTKGVMSAGDLQTFSDQFNNWDSAAESVSKLNAALGGTSLNIADLMRADPTEKLMMLKRSFDESGQDFDKLNIGYKRLLAEGFGGDVAKAGAFFKGSLQEANAEMTKMAATEKELEERKKKSVAAQEKLSKAIDTMKIALTPIIDLFSKIAESLAWISDKTGGFGTFLLVGLPLAITAARGLFKMWGSDVNFSFMSIFKNISGAVDTLTAKIRGAKAEAATIPAGGSGGGGGGDGGGGGGGSATGDAAELLESAGGKLAKKGGKFAKFGKMLPGIGKVLGLAGAAYGLYSAAQPQTPTEQQPQQVQADSMNEHQDGEESLAPGNNKKYLVEGNRAVASFAADDYVQAKGAKNPSNITGVNTDTKLVEAINNSTNVSTTALVSTKDYAKQLSQSSSEYKKTIVETDRERTKEMIKETVPAIAQNIKVQSEVTLSGNIGLDPTAIDKIHEKSNSKVS